jgi:hypothetical protein
MSHWLEILKKKRRQKANEVDTSFTFSNHRTLFNMLGRVYAVASSAFCRGAMKEDLLHVGGSEEAGAGAEVSVESVVVSASVFTEGLLAMHRREVLEVRVGGPRIIWSQGIGKLCCKTVETMDSLASSKPLVEQLVERPNQTSDNSNSSTSGTTNLVAFSSWIGTVFFFFFVAQSLCMQACKIFVLARQKKPPDRRYCFCCCCRRRHHRVSTLKWVSHTFTRSVSLRFVSFFFLQNAHGGYLVEEKRQGDDKTISKIDRVLCYLCFGLPPSTSLFVTAGLATGSGLRRRRVTIIFIVRVSALLWCRRLPTSSLLFIIAAWATGSD